MEASFELKTSFIYKAKGMPNKFVQKKDFFERTLEKSGKFWTDGSEIPVRLGAQKAGRKMK
jgi:hypothetical protein